MDFTGPTNELYNALHALREAQVWWLEAIRADF